MEENEKILLRKISESKGRIKVLENQCQAAKDLQQNINIEICNLGLRETALTESIETKRQQENRYRRECEKLSGEISDIIWRRKLLLVKCEIEEDKRKHYENLMENFTFRNLDFLDVDEYKRKLHAKKEEETLKIEINALNDKIKQRQEFSLQCDQDYLTALDNHNVQSARIRSLNEKIENIEAIIQAQEDELKCIGNDKNRNSNLK